MKTCPICLTVFQPAVPHQEYDRLTCRKMAERQRARLRDKGAQVVTKSHYGAAEHMTVMITTREALNSMSQVYLNNPRALPTRFMSPPPEDWTAPAGVMFGHQAEGFWLMCSTDLFNNPPKAPTETFVDTTPRRSAVSILDEALLGKTYETPTEPPKVEPRGV
jgi:hypothetical protein